MKPGALKPAKLIRRYKRFLADIELADGRIVTAHCANPGAMTGLAKPGMTIWVEENFDPKRKLRYSWKLAELGNGHFAGIDTGAANRIVSEALENGRIQEFASYSDIRREVPYGAKSRVDFLLKGDQLPDLYLEIKSVTLCRHKGLAEFPDSVTKRGAKHLADLAAMVHQGHAAALLFLVQRTDCHSCAVAGDIDPAYQAAFLAAQKANVHIFCYDCHITPQEIRLNRALPVAESA